MPVAGRNVGGIPLQVVDGSTGFLINTVEEAAERITRLLKNREEAKTMGEAGRSHVLKNFLIARDLKDWPKLLGELI